VGDTKILENYLNSASKNTSETFILVVQNPCWPVLLVTKFITPKRKSVWTEGHKAPGLPCKTKLRFQFMQPETVNRVMCGVKTYSILECDARSWCDNFQCFGWTQKGPLKRW